MKNLFWSWSKCGAISLTSYQLNSGKYNPQIEDLMQKIHNSIANALDLRPFALTNCISKSKLNASTDSHDWLCCHIEFVSPYPLLLTILLQNQQPHIILYNPRFQFNSLPMQRMSETCSRAYLYKVVSILASPYRHHKWTTHLRSSFRCDVLLHWRQGNSRRRYQLVTQWKCT